MTETEIAIERAKYLMRIAADFIEKYAASDTWEYDGALCDGYCLAEDLHSAANDLEIVG